MPVLFEALSPEAADAAHISPAEHRPTWRLTPVRVARLGWIALLLVCYVMTYLIYVNHEHLSAYTSSIRGFVFPAPDALQEQLSTQYMVPDLSVTMGREDAGNALDAYQRRCQAQEFASNPLDAEFYLCDIIRIDFDDLEGTNSDILLECGEKFVNDVVESGDDSSYGSNPTALDAFYENNHTPEDQRYSTTFNQNNFHPLLAPLVQTGDDAEAGILGPLSSVHDKLNRLWKSLVHNTEPPFNDNPKELTIGASSRRKPGMSRFVDRNHHWDYLFACNPGTVKVTFAIKRALGDQETEYSHKGDYIDFLRYDIRFDRLGGAFYQARTLFHGLRQPRHHSLWTLIWPAVTIALQLGMFLVPLVAVLVAFPRNLYRFIRHSLPFDEVMSDMVDPLHGRLRRFAWAMVCIENVAAALYFVAVATSLVMVLFPSGPMAFSTGFEKRTSMMNIVWGADWLSFQDKLIESVFGLFADNQLHVLVITMLSMRLTEILFLMQEAAFLLMTFAFCFLSMVQFLSVFACIILLFSIIIHVRFGAYFYQFSKFGRTFVTLAYFAFDFYGAADFTGLKDMEETNSAALMRMLLVFKIFVTVLILNMGTTIVLDAYAISVKNVGRESRMAKIRDRNWQWFKERLGYADKQGSDFSDEEAAQRDPLLPQRDDSTDSDEDTGQLRQEISKIHVLLSELKNR
ncbi:MAG: uncharacterized protein KVP18_002341 [Porospora cf. gigantea A]|uniref:uncharacterized protein n=2 Tax=Porospora cf. gigantea A TaxID=2853593 RepID=UPI00355A6885|nr:MAG: hypothetical protein KVP18_002341 [Porospora cf. gigantea A]